MHVCILGVIDLRWVAIEAARTPLVGGSSASSSSYSIVNAAVAGTSREPSVGDLRLKFEAVLDGRLVEL